MTFDIENFSPLMHANHFNVEIFDGPDLLEKTQHLIKTVHFDEYDPAIGDYSGRIELFENENFDGHKLLEIIREDRPFHLVFNAYKIGGELAKKLSMEVYFINTEIKYSWEDTNKIATYIITFTQ